MPRASTTLCSRRQYVTDHRKPQVRYIGSCCGRALHVSGVVVEMELPGVRA